MFGGPGRSQVVPARSPDKCRLGTR